MSEACRAGLHIPADEDPNTVYTTGATVQRVTDTGKFLFVEDPQLGSFTLGGPSTPYERLVYDLMTTPGLDRSDGVSQLCKDESSATIPNTALFTRKSGMIALAGMAEYFAGRTGMSEEQKVALMLEVALDDRAHMDYSHATELWLQGWGGRENKHEELWPEYAEHGGESNVLRAHGVVFDESLRMPGIKLPAWANAEAPDLDLDRLQYTVAELLLWFDHDGSPEDVRQFIRQICSLDNFGIDADGHLAFKDKETALIFSKGYLLLATEHWNDPINRMQLYLQIQAAQRLVIKRRFPWMDEIDKGQTRRPEWYFYGVDQDIVDALNENHGHTDPTLYAIHGVLNPIASAERKRFFRYKGREYIGFLRDEQARDYPSEFLSPKRVEFGLSHPSVAITMTASTEGERRTATKMPLLNTSPANDITYTLLPLKNRYVDPRILRADGSSIRLSEVDANYAALLHEQQELQAMKTNVELVFAGGFRGQFIGGIRANENDFDKLAGNPDFTADQKRRMIEMAARRAREQSVALGRLVLS